MEFLLNDLATLERRYNAPASLAGSFYFQKYGLQTSAVLKLMDKPTASNALEREKGSQGRGGWTKPSADDGTGGGGGRAMQTTQRSRKSGEDTGLEKGWCQPRTLENKRRDPAGGDPKKNQLKRSVSTNMMFRKKSGQGGRESSSNP